MSAVEREPGSSPAAGRCEGACINSGTEHPRAVASLSEENSWASSPPWTLFFGCAGSSLQCVGISCCGAQTLEHLGSLVVAPKLSCPNV